MSNQRSFEEQFSKDILDSMRNVTISDPTTSVKDAFLKAAEGMLKNNPWVPPAGNKCPVHDLPNEIMAYIFALGIKMEEEEEDEDDEDYQPGEDDEEEDGDDADEEGDEADKHEKQRKKKTRGGGGVGDGERGGNRSGDEKTPDQEPFFAKPQRFLVGGTEVQVIRTNFSLKDVTPNWRDYPIFRGTPIPDDEDVKQADEEKSPIPEDPDGGNEKGGKKKVEEEEDHDDTTLQFQVLVSHVCRRWRDIALNSPLFWTKFTFAEGIPFEKSRIWLERAQNAPLDLEIDCTVDDEDDDEDVEAEVKSEGEVEREPEPPINKEALTAIIDLILPYISQWRALRVMVSYYEYMHILLSRLSKCPAAPQLEVLKLCHYEDCEEYDTFEPCDFVTPFQIFGGTIPNLKELGLWGVHLDWELSLGLFNNLVDLELAYHAKNVRPSFPTFSAMVLASPHLETLKLGLSGPAGGAEDWGDEVVEVSPVAELVLNYHESKYVQELMAHLITPNVQRLGLAYDAEDYSEFGRQLAKPMPGKSQSLLAGLKQLKISGLPCDTATIEMIFDQLTALELLNLNCTSQEGDAFFCVLSRPKSPSSGGGSGSGTSTGNSEANEAGPSTHTRTTSTAGERMSVYCPRLHTLTTTGISGTQMKSFVEFRKKAGAPIKAVFMGQDDEISDKEETWLMNNLESLQYFMPSDDEEVIDEEDMEEWATESDSE